MLQETAVFGLSLAYLGLLFAVAWLGDRHARTWSTGAAGPVVYSLSLAIYCTSWTFYGAVGRAATSGLDFILIYVGPALVIVAGYPLLRKMVQAAKRNNVTSIADFLASRYGKSRAVAVTATLFASIGVLPYIALQLQAVSSSFRAIAGSDGGGASVVAHTDTSLFVAALMALFTILFGVRNVQASEQHRGMMLAIAFESVVKLAALLAVGPFVLFVLFDGPADLLARVVDTPALAARITNEGPTLNWLVTTLLAGAAFLCLPRQFHVAVVEHDHASSLKTARWLFPFYLALINLFVVPLALGGLLLLGPGSNPDLFVLNLPMRGGEGWLSAFVFIGGLSAATSMVIVACMALSSMIGNELVMPYLLRREAGRVGEMGPLVLMVRRLAVVLILLAGYAYEQVISGYLPLASIGMISFCAVANFAPGVLFGLYWRRAHRFGVVAGMLGGFAVWLYALLLPSLQATNGGRQSAPLQAWMPGPFAELDPVGQGFIVCMLVNTLLLVGVSLLARPLNRDRQQANSFVLGTEPEQHPSPVPVAATRIAELRDLLARFIGPERAERVFAGGPLSTQAALARTERALSGTLGAASARVIVAASARRGLIFPGTARAIIDEASEAIRYNYEILRNTLDHVGLGIAAFDRGGRLEISNERFTALLSLDADKVAVGAHAALLGGPDEIARLLSRPETPQVHELVSGGRVVELRLDPLPGSGFVATCHDVTARVRTAEALRDSERRIRVYTDNVPVLIAYLDKDERYRFTNLPYQQALNLPARQTEGRTALEVVGAERYARLKPFIDGVLAGQEQHFEIEFPTNDVKIEIAAGTYIPHVDHTGGVVGFFLLYQDITQARRAEAELRQSKENLEQRVVERTAELEASRAEAEAANLGKTRFIAAASHDLLQPLHAARLFTAALIDREPDNDLGGKIDLSLGAVESLIDALLDISKLDAGAFQPETRPFALQPLFESLATAFAPLAQHKGVELRVVPTRAFVSTDPAFLRRILQNLLSNAIRYGAVEGRPQRVLLGCRRDGDALRIEVRDNGPGIPADKRTVIFDEFVRLNPDEERGERGLGLGLAIVERIGRMLDLPIALSSATGSGSTFHVTVPRVASVIAAPAAQPAQPAATVFEPGAFVLCIDNEAQVREAMAALIAGWGCQVGLAATLDEAIAAVDRTGRFPDLLVADLHLDEGPDGLEIIETLRRRWALAVPAALITADRDPTLRPRARARGVELLHKPVKPAALRALLRLRNRATERLSA
ncbi:MAG: NahK/ErcS family hybrid sensor histidine kinase/response regulator [Reyranellaceae bacterium]